VLSIVQSGSRSVAPGGAGPCARGFIDSPTDWQARTMWLPRASLVRSVGRARRRTDQADAQHEPNGTAFAYWLASRWAASLLRARVPLTWSHQTHRAADRARWRLGDSRPYGAVCMMISNPVVQSRSVGRASSGAQLALGPECGQCSNGHRAGHLGSSPACSRSGRSHTCRPRPQIFCQAAESSSLRGGRARCGCLQFFYREGQAASLSPLDPGSVKIGLRVRAR